MMMKNYVWTVEFPLKMINELGVDFVFFFVNGLKPFLLLYYVLIEGEWVDSKINSTISIQLSILQFLS